MKYIYAIALCMALALPVVSYAQYDHIRQPLSAEEMALFKKNKVLGELQKVVENDEEKNYRARAIDTGGRLLANITYKNAQYYLYDNAGRVIAHIDSARNTDGTFTVNSYNFTYDEKSGKLAQAVTPQGTINFSYNPKQNVLTQAYVDNDTLKLSKYYFDKENRLVVIEGLNHQNKLVNKVERVFSSNGTLHREEVVGIYPAGTDSTVITYTYNAAKKLVQKQIFSYRKFYISAGGSSQPTHSAEQASVGTINFTYDKKGNKIAEEFTHSIDKFSNYYSTWQYNEKGLPVKRTFKKGPFPPEILVYQYGYFE